MGVNWKEPPAGKRPLCKGGASRGLVFGKDVVCFNQLRKDDFLLLNVLTGVEFYKPGATGRAGEKVIVCLTSIKIGGIENSPLQIMDIDFVNISVSTWNTLKLSWQYADGKRLRMADGSYSGRGANRNRYYYKRHAVEIINAKIVTAGDVYVDRIFSFNRTCGKGEGVFCPFGG